ncbi:hypothetical protein IFM89_038006 [Coptis chinensis]|uniref:Nodulin-like domain-containing protein n=1 Tax=Coptis chinensis TaxID=261450 RepID=A0A835I9B0_9MAGN|nr:hypothetical protein IFM89_038006 [Coptis chinensis]
MSKGLHEIDEMKRQLDARDADMEIRLMQKVANFAQMVSMRPGPVVGILKGFAGPSGAILTRDICSSTHLLMLPIIFMVAVGPSMVVIALMFIVRPVGGHRQIRSSDGTNFAFIYSVCLVLAAYLMGIMIVEDILDPTTSVVMIFTITVVCSRYCFRLCGSCAFKLFLQLMPL